MIRNLLLTLILALAACTPAEAPDGEAPSAPTPASVDRPVEAPAAPDTLVLTTDDRELRDRPAAPVRVVGACPFEGCQYGTWTASAETTVYRAAGDTTSIAFTVPAGTRLDATEGFVLMTQVGIAIAERPSEVYVSPEDQRPVAPGDTLLVLDYEGEGSFRVWTDGTLGFSMDVMATGGAGDEGRPFRIVTEPEQQWWARVTAPDGRSGWLWMDRTRPVDGADALGVP